jgi:hypothetical protein
VTKEQLDRRRDVAYTNVLIGRGRVGRDESQLYACSRTALLAVNRSHTYVDIRMNQSDRLLLRILGGTWDANIPFEGLCQLLRRLGFDARIRGSHHIFTKEGIEEILNLQPKGRHAKPYQVKQVRQVILKYRLRGQDNE